MGQSQDVHQQDIQLTLSRWCTISAVPSNLGSSGAPLSEAGTASFCLLPFTKPPRVACLALPFIHSQSGAGKPVILCLLALTAVGRDQKFVRAALVGGKVW